MDELVAISEKLDYSVQISISANQTMELMFAHTEGAIPLYATIDGDRTKITVYLDRQHNTKLDRVLGETTHTTMGNYEIYDIGASDLSSQLQTLKRITAIPSVVPSGFFFKDGRIYAYFRFHQSSLDKMSDVIREILVGQDRIKLSYLGKSTGLIKALEDMNSRIPLSMISFMFPREPDFVLPLDSEQDPIAEIKHLSEGMDSEYDVVRYSKIPENDGPSIFIADGVYESRHITEFMKTFKRKVQEERVPIASAIGVYQKEFLKNYVIVPTFISDHVLCMLYETARINNNVTLKLISFVPFESPASDRHT